MTKPLTSAEVSFVAQYIKSDLDLQTMSRKFQRGSAWPKGMMGEKTAAEVMYALGQWAEKNDVHAGQSATQSTEKKLPPVKKRTTVRR